MLFCLVEQLADNTSMNRQRNIFKMTHFVLLVFLILIKNSFSKEASHLRRNLSVLQNDSPSDSNTQRPKMYTFFTRFSQDIEQELLDSWKKAWYEAGWEPVVLGLEDAKRHPNYRRFIDAFEQADYRVLDFDRLCFLRWLAMGVSGGGWMSDFDTFPLYSNPLADGLKLPNEGKFTCYSRHVPNLVSGSASEWNRMSDLIFLSYKLHQDTHWSDMLAFLEIHEKVNGYIYHEDSIPLERLYWKELNEGGISRPFALSSKCKDIAGKRAMHFSSADCKRVEFCDKKRSRGYEWLQAWKEKCNPEII